MKCWEKVGQVQRSGGSRELVQWEGGLCGGSLVSPIKSGFQDGGGSSRCRMVGRRAAFRGTHKMGASLTSLRHLKGTGVSIIQ